MMVNLQKLPATVTPYQLPITKLPPDWMATSGIARLCQLEHPSFGHLKVVADDGAEPAAMLEEVQLKMNKELIALRFQRPVMAPLLRRAGLLADRQTLENEPNLAALVLEHVLSPALFTAEAHLDLPMSIVSVRPAGQSDWSATPVLRLKAVSSLWMGVVRIELAAGTAEGANLVRKVVQGLAPPPLSPTPDLMADCAIRSPDFLLPLAELAALVPGDALHLDNRWLGLSELTFAVAGRPVAPVAWRDGKITLSRCQLTNPKEELQPMSQPQIDDVFSVDDLLVKLVLELDTLEVPFATLSGLRAGAVIPCDRPLPETVRVLANGKHFATAGLVQIDGRLGLKIISLAGKPA